MLFAFGTVTLNVGHSCLSASIGKAKIESDCSRSDCTDTMNKIARYTGIVLINILIIAVLLEGLLRIVAPNLGGTIGVTARYITTGQPYAESWTPAWQQNRDHFYALRPNINNELQYGSPTVQFNLSTIELWDGGGIGFRTDPINFFVNAVVVGDSFGFCFTEREDCWVDRLSNQMGLGIVNLSQPVTGTVSHGRILQDFGAPLTPSLVIWQFFGNDFNDDYGLSVFRGEREELPDTSPQPIITPNPFETLERSSVLFGVLKTVTTGQIVGAPDSEALFVKPYTVTYGANNEHTLQFGGAYELQALDMSRQENLFGLSDSQRAFTQAKALVDTWGGEIVVVMMPTREEVYAHLTEPQLGQLALFQLSSAREAMQEICFNTGLRCFDPYDVFVERALQGEALYHVDDMHLNAHGNAVLATALEAWLIEQGLPNSVVASGR